MGPNPCNVTELKSRPRDGSRGQTLLKPFLCASHSSWVLQPLMFKTLQEERSGANLHRGGGKAPRGTVTGPGHRGEGPVSAENPRPGSQVQEALESQVWNLMRDRVRTSSGRGLIGTDKGPEQQGFWK